MLTYEYLAPSSKLFDSNYVYKVNAQTGVGVYSREGSSDSQGKAVFVRLDATVKDAELRLQKVQIC